jgi:SpoVK/Ycf46/Vps4 family AAA+-type ATPase
MNDIYALGLPAKKKNALYRFDRLLDVQPPDEGDREDIFRIHTCKMPCSPDVNLSELARLTEGYTGADIKLACREAAVVALDVSYPSLHILVNVAVSIFIRWLQSSLMNCYTSNRRTLTFQKWQPGISRRQ